MSSLKEYRLAVDLHRLEIVKHRNYYFWYKLFKLLTFRTWSLRTILTINCVKSTIMLNYYYEYRIFTIEISGSYKYIRARTHTHTHTHTTHKHTHTCTHIHKKGVTVYILVSGISSEGALELRFGATAQVRETNFVNWCDAWRGCLIRQHKMSFYKVGWSQELNILKECSVALVRFWEKRLDAVAESIKF